MKIECFNCGGLGYFASDCSSPKDIKKSMQAIWSDIDSKENGQTTFEDARYDHNDFLTFVAFMEFVHGSECDSDSNDNFIDDKKVTLLNNLVVEYKKTN